jgi:hypothetical protein
MLTLVWDAGTGARVPGLFTAGQPPAGLRAGLRPVHVGSVHG